MINLNIRSKKTVGEVPLITYLRIGDKNHTVNLHLMVDVVQWKEVSSSKKKMENFLDRKGYSERLVEIEFGLKELKRQSNFTIQSVETMIQDIILKEKREKYLEQKKIGKEIRKMKEKSIKNYLTNFVQQMETGEVRNNKNELYAKQTIKIWKQFKRVFLDFYNQKPFTWDEIDKTLVNRYITYLEKCDYLKRTREKYLSVFKQMIIDAEKAGLHTNYVAKNLIKKLNVKESDKTKEIYLTKEELEGMYDMELSGTEEIVRDMFLIGCYTAQRFSDFSSIHSSCIGITANGVRVIRMEQKKTQNMVVIPITDDKLEILLRKYDYTVPSISDQKFNRTIKEIGKKLAETIPSLAKKESTLLKKQEKIAEKRKKRTFERVSQENVLKPRWQLISTHTARRSGITNMFLSRKYTIPQMMSISGHKDERTFLDYVKLSLDEFAEEVAKSSCDGMF